MTNGCICCTLRDDLLQEVDRLAHEGRFDYLLIESSGISEPMPVAAAFSFPRDDGATLGDLARRPRVTGLWSQAGAVPRFEPSGARGPETTQGQELVFIGTGLRPASLRAALGACLPAPGEPVPADDFPAWETYGTDDACDLHEPASAGAA